MKRQSHWRGFRAPNRRALPLLSRVPATHFCGLVPGGGEWTALTRVAGNGQNRGRVNHSLPRRDKFGGAIQPADHYYGVVRCTGSRRRRCRGKSFITEEHIMSTTGWIVIAVIVGVALWVMGVYNSLVALGQRVSQAFADIDVQLRQRHDLIPNLVETVKGYATHERGTLEAVVQARTAAVGAQGQDAK